MAPAANAVLAMRIGADELKAVYQRNMITALLLASGLALSGIVSVNFYSSLQVLPEEPPRVFVLKTHTTMRRPPRMVNRPEIGYQQPTAKLPAFGIPTPVPDEEIVEEIEFATIEELALLAGLVSGTDDWGDQNYQYALNVAEEEFFPAPDSFINVEEMPVLVHEELPVYPELAQRAGIEGALWVKALVDREGRVRDALIAKKSGSNAGFEESALAAARKNRFRPAVQNGRPIAVWVSYQVVFRLDDCKR